MQRICTPSFAACSISVTCLSTFAVLIFSRESLLEPARVAWMSGF